MTTILILDDEHIIRQSLSDYFDDQDWQTHVAESAEIALDLLKQHTFSAAIVDIRLPGIDGNEFIRRSAPHHPSMGFLICTGSPDFSIPPELHELPNVSSWLCRKPLRDLTELKQRLVQLMSYLNTD
ncbi:MAG: response regulator [Candidatus Thiodiazotropha sp.]